MLTKQWNIFRILGDVLHTTSKVILISAIHSNSSAEGVSLITQSLYAAVFCARYLNIFTSPATGDWQSVWNFTLKLFYTLSSFYIIFLMTKVYARTREREKAWKFGMLCLLGSSIATPFWYMLFRKWVRGDDNTFMKMMWVFSEILESVCVLPQLLLLRQTTVPTVLDSFYLVTLGSYRFMYILNWIERGVKKEPGYKDLTSWVFGTIQTLLIIDFAWVYWSRQRVKLRKGGVVDSDDLRHGWLVGRFVGRKSADLDYDEEGAEARNSEEQPRNSWGRTGVSVSADEGVSGQSSLPRGTTSGTGESQPLADPAAFDYASDDEAAPPPVNYASGGARAGNEWNDDVDDDAPEHIGVSK